MKMIRRDEFKTKHMKKNVRAGPARKDHHSAQVRSQFTKLFTKATCNSARVFYVLFAQPEIKENYHYQNYQKDLIFRIKGWSLMRPNWPKLSSLAQKTSALDSFQFFGAILVSKG